MTPPPLPNAMSAALVLLFLSTTAWPKGAAPPETTKEAAASLNGAAARCRLSSNLDVCYDAVRRRPGDPELLTALGDALMRAKRPVDAVRNYRRAAQITPNARGLAAKIGAAEAQLTARRSRTAQPAARASQPAARAAADEGGASRFSNAAPEAQSH